MSQPEFASVVVDCAILTKKEICLMLKHYSGVGVESSLPFIHSSRTGLLHRIYRFGVVNPPRMPLGPWAYTHGHSDALNLTVSKPVMLHGVQHFGSEGGKYTVSLEVKDVMNGFSLVKQVGTYSSKKDETNGRSGYYGFDVMFDQPICLEAGKTYEIVSLIKGPLSWYVTEGKESGEVQGIQFTLSRSPASVNNTGVNDGQFPAFIFNKI